MSHVDRLQKGSFLDHFWWLFRFFFRAFLWTEKRPLKLHTTGPVFDKRAQKGSKRGGEVGGNSPVFAPCFSWGTLLGPGRPQGGPGRSETSKMTTNSTFFDVKVYQNVPKLCSCLPKCIKKILKKKGERSALYFSLLEIRVCRQS